MNTPTKTCLVCGKTKPEESFKATVSRYKDKIYRCRKKTCNTCASNIYRAKNPEKERARQRKYVKDNPLLVKVKTRERCIRQAKVKLERKIQFLTMIDRTSCQECGQTNPRVLSFHHRDPNDKSYEVSAAIYKTNPNIPDLLKEVAKCDVLCLNCHHLRHVLA